MTKRFETVLDELSSRSAASSSTRHRSSHDRCSRPREARRRGDSSSPARTATARDELKRVAGMLRTVGANILGVVVNELDRRDRDSYSLQLLRLRSERGRRQHNKRRSKGAGGAATGRPLLLRRCDLACDRQETPPSSSPRLLIGSSIGEPKLDRRNQKRKAREDPSLSASPSAQCSANRRRVRRSSIVPFAPPNGLSVGCPECPDA